MGVGRVVEAAHPIPLAAEASFLKWVWTGGGGRGETTALNGVQSLTLWASPSQVSLCFVAEAMLVSIGEKSGSPPGTLCRGRGRVTCTEQGCAPWCGEHLYPQSRANQEGIRTDTGGGPPGQGCHGRGFRFALPTGTWFGGVGGWG